MKVSLLKWSAWRKLIVITFSLVLVLFSIRLFCIQIYGKPSALYAALKENDFDKAERCLYWGADVNGFLMWGWSKSNKGNTLLTAAVRYSDVEVVKFLLDKGAEVNKKDGFESTPAGISATRGSLEIIRLLSSFGADFEMRSQEFTPLERAKKIKNEAATDLIREILQNK